MELAQAQAIAQDVVNRLAPFCERIEVAGSIRRRRPFPRDIDIVLLPEHQGNLAVELLALGDHVKAGKSLMQRTYKGAQVDLYFATPETWHTLLLIRTGSKEHNIRLVTLAKKRGWHLYANGRGLFNEKDERIAGDSEESFFKALGLPYKEPWERES